eukprot:TRINITY_DN3019_c0_g1_i4.p1 TRINITY_DN3019_c0_g1~~TRINITY_DN3019_c0_g1_i4.p1  ORF type:complete len:244 (+),score=70.08 TRINITY_DN3019_c0_g1_i4:78-809(+)
MTAAAQYMIPNASLGQAFGVVSSVCFAFQYIPQAYLNYQRKSVRGFSTTGITLKLIGASFLLANSWLNGETYPVIMYGLLNVMQHSAFMIQFSMYPSDEEHADQTKRLTRDERTGRERFLLWLLFPFLPLLLGQLAPSTMAITNYIKPITQLLSHIPQLKVCYDLASTAGVAMLSQHLNFIGGALGLYMCFVIPPVSSTTYIIYFNSCFQALSLYAMALYFRSPSGSRKARAPYHPFPASLPL